MRKKVEFIENATKTRLDIVLLPEGKECIQKSIDNGEDIKSDGLMDKLLEYQLCNGWHRLLPENYGWLVDKELWILSNDITMYGENDEELEFPRILDDSIVYLDKWHAVRSLVETLYRLGSVQLNREYF